MHELAGERIVLRPLEPAVAVELAELGADPEVARWWPNMTPEDLLGEDDRTLAFAIELEGRPIGVAQAWEENEPDYRHAGIDLFIAAPWQGRGLGTDAVRTLARHLVRERGHHRVTIDPALENERAIRCYERVGFKRVGVLRRYERAGDGTWRDGLLLDLLAEELD